MCSKHFCVEICINHEFEIVVALTILIGVSRVDFMKTSVKSICLLYDYPGVVF